MYPTDVKNGVKLNYNKYEENIMLKTIQNLCYNNKNTTNFNMSSPFLVDNILQQKTAELQSQYLNQQIENYVFQKHYSSRENSPEIDEQKPEDETQIEKNDDDDSKSNEDVKNEAYPDYYPEKDVLSIPNFNRRCQTCGTFECPPYTCKKSGIKRLEELEKRFNLYQENSDEDKERFTQDEIREEFNETKKPLLKFSVSAILGEREDRKEVNGKLDL